MHVLITGAAGVVGGCAIEALGPRHTLTLLDQRPHPTRPTLLVDLSDPVAVLANLALRRREAMGYEPQDSSGEAMRQHLERIDRENASS